MIAKLTTRMNTSEGRGRLLTESHPSCAIATGECEPSFLCPVWYRLRYGHVNCDADHIYALCLSNVSQSARRRSRSACGSLSPLSPEDMPPFYARPTSFASSSASFGHATPMMRGRSMQLSPTLSRGTKTPPLRPRSPQPIRRRRHSCVAPNTEEFHRLAAMFGWVTMSTTDSWHKRTGRHRRDLTTSRLDGSDSPPQYSSATQAVACDSEDDSDHDEYPQRRTFTEWDVSHESSCLQSPIQDFHALNGSIEHLAALSDFGLASFPETLRTQWLTFSGESWNDQDQRTTVMESSNESTADTAHHEQDHLTVECHDDHSVPDSHPGSRGSSSTDCLDETLPQGSLYCCTAELPREVASSSYPSSTGYVYRPVSTAQLDIDAVVQSTEEANVSAATPPLVPPRFPEINARAFDLPAEEGPDMIVYASPSPSGEDSTSGVSELPPIIAGTIVKLIEKLTHQYGMDTGFVTDFFLTYRLFMSPVQLCKYLIQRYLWALETETEHRLVVRVRTFVVLRYWIKEHFADDFLTSKSLRFQMASFLNQMRFHPSVKVSSLDARIIRYLMDFFKHQRKVYKSLAQQSLDIEQKQSEPINPTQKGSEDPVQGERKVDVLSRQMEDSKSAEVERLKVTAVQRDLDPVASNITTMGDADSSQHPGTVKGRLRASTLASTPSRPMAGEPLTAQTHAKPPLSRECRAQSMARQTSEGGSLFARERRLSSSSTKSNRSTSNWSTKMTIGISKLRQKSEDIYQQFVHPSSGHYRGDTRLCVCWNSAYTGIDEHHTLSTTRSFPNLRPSVVVTNVFQDAASPQASTVNVSGPPPSKSIRRLKSSLSLGLSSSNTASSPAPSPTRNQFSSISVRHSRSNSNTSTGYHPNPECPFHTPCQSATGKETLRSHREPLDDSDTALKTLKEALQDEYVEAATQPPVPPLPSSIPASPAWQYSPWHTPGQLNSPSATSPSYKPFILFYRSQLIAQQLCLLEQHFLQQVKWDELLEIELTKAGRKNRAKVQSTISGYLFKTERNHNGMEASNERSNMLCMWVASEVVSTRPIEDRVRVIEKFIRIAQKCYQYRNFNSLMQLVMGLGSSHLCGLRRTWGRVNGYEMRVLQDLQDFISPCSNWNVIRRAMNQVGHQDMQSEQSQRHSTQGLDVGRNASHPPGFESNGSHVALSNEPGHSKYLQHQVPLDKQGCIPFLGLFVFDLTHIAVSPSWYLPPSSVCPESTNGSGQDSPGLGSVPPTPMGASYPANAAHLQAPEPRDLQHLLPTGRLLVHFHRYQLIAKTVKWFVAFQRRSQKYTFHLDSTLYSKCLLLRVLSNDHVRELADSCEND
ncbi:unnamed protein product [Mortierella alpina]